MKRKSVATFKYVDSDPANGILQYTYNKTKSNFLSIDSQVSITASSYDESVTLNPYIIITNNFKMRSYFQTLNYNNSWIQFEFSDIQVVIMSYAYQALEHDFHLKWQIQGSNDNVLFHVIDEQTIEGYDEGEMYNFLFLHSRSFLIISICS